METHDAAREYPFPCPLENCTKKFVRKTDLQRHHQSVHMKQRNHRCDYCSRFFARKDTLRRHMEDGCAKRFDIGSVEFPPEYRPQSYAPSDPNMMKMSSATLTDSLSRHPSYSSSAQYSTPPGSSHSQGQHSPLTSAPGSFMDRQQQQQEYMNSANDQNHQNGVWGT